MPYVQRDEAKIYYEQHGRSGPCLFCGPPVFATPISDAHADLREAFIGEFSSSHRLLLIDYPYGAGNSGPVDPPRLTPSRATDDLLAVADAAGFGRFVWYGYSWGAVLGLQLALKTDRVEALVAGGFPPLEGPYEQMLRLCVQRVESPWPGYSADYMRQFVTYYAGLQGFDDLAEVPALQIPAMTFVGDRDGGTAPQAGEAPFYAHIVKHQTHLEALGWRVHVLPGDGHEGAMKAERVLPILRDFLDSIERQMMADGAKGA